MLFPGRYYTREWKLETVTQKWNFLKNKNITVSNKNEINTVLGSIKYQNFVVANLRCVSFIHSWGPISARDTHNTYVRPRHIYGYYCDKSALSENTVNAVLSGIGVRGYRVPPKPKPKALTEQENLLQKLGANPYEIVFTTGLDENKKPTDSISEISMKESSIDIFIKWNLESFEIDPSVIEYEVFDSLGNRVIYSMDWFEPESKIWNTWKRILFKTYHEPGKWKFEVRLDDRKVIEKYLTVSSD